MAAGTKVQLRLGERVVAEVSFRNDELRIGRMKENDLIINNLAVSRFHAVLRRVGEGYEIEDLGSENGTLLDGAPVIGKMPMPAGGALTIGKHTLSISDAAESGSAQAPRPLRSDAWDAQQTFFAPGLAAPAAAAKPVPEKRVPVTVDDDGSGVPIHSEPTAPARAQSVELPDPDGLFAFAEEELQKPAPPAPSFDSEFDVAPPEPPPSLALVAAPAVAPAAPTPVAVAPARPDPAGQTALFDFGATTDLGLSDGSLARATAAARAAAPTPEAAGHAGLIVERRGKVERVAPLRGDELIIGRGPSSDLVLPAAGVSRKHARLVREGESYRVFDLGSANGVRVNGERATDHLLQVGDVLGIDDFTLTFVIDREPMEAVVRSAPQAPAPAAPQATVLQDAPLASILEQDLVTAEDGDADVLDGEKELEIVAELTHAPVASLPLVLDAAWVVEVSVATESLPPELRDALAGLDGDELRLPAELVFRKR